MFTIPQEIQNLNAELIATFADRSPSALDWGTVLQESGYYNEAATEALGSGDPSDFVATDDSGVNWLFCSIDRPEGGWEIRPH